MSSNLAVSIHGGGSILQVHAAQNRIFSKPTANFQHGFLAAPFAGKQGFLGLPAQLFGCVIGKKIQLFKGKFDQKMIDRAHENGIICNVFWSDNEEEAREYLAMGIDTILTNDYNLISQIVRK